MALRGKRIRHQVDLGEAEFALLCDASEMFGLDRSEVMRRLLRGAMQVGPAMSDDNDQRFADTAKTLRLLRREIEQMVAVLRSGGDSGVGRGGQAGATEEARPTGQAVDPEETQAVWAAILEQVAGLDKEMSDIIVSYGIRLRKAAELVVSSETV